MWDAKTKQLVADGKLAVIGIVQEQHAERARLYKQWRQYEFPIAQDAVTQLGLAVVPVPILIDEHGIVMSTRPQPNKIGALVAQKSAPPGTPAPKLTADHRDQILAGREASLQAGGQSVCILGDAYLDAANAGDEPAANIGHAIEAYQSFLKNNAKSKLEGHVHFRLGVAYRMRFDQASSEEQDPNDFTLAAKHWSLALAVNPNQYIWRRRIQQYGPRLDKPYPFYDWVPTALKEIEARGETPVEQTVALAGAEKARPDRRFKANPEQAANPDPDARIELDSEMVRIHPTAVPQSISPGKAVRVHLRLDPLTAMWNNESEDMIVWIEPSEFGTLTQSHWSVPNPKTAESAETRNIEFEFKTGRSAKTSFELEGYALYYICQQKDGQCLYRRQNFTIPITIDSATR